MQEKVSAKILGDAVVAPSVTDFPAQLNTLWGKCGD